MEGGDSQRDGIEAGDARAEDALSRFLPADEPGIVRIHHVTALLVAHEGGRWLPRTLGALAGQSRPPDRTVAVDAGSSDDGRWMLQARFAGALREADAAGFAEALVLATSGAPATSGDGATEREPVRWYWIIHDDSAPEPSALERLLEGADRNPASHVLIPKSVAWSDQGRLVGIGNMWAPGTPVVERLEPGEQDQGQYDVDRPVYGGETAGMLVRADTWHALHGLDPRYDRWGSGADLCRRVWGGGWDVTFIPHAVIAHRQAGRLAVRAGRTAPLASSRAARRGQLLLELTQSPAGALPWRWLRGWLSTLVRAVALLLTREPEESLAELAGAWDVLAHPGRVRSGRRRLRQPPVVSTTRPAHVRARRGAVLHHAVDAWAAARRLPDPSARRRVGRAIAPPLAIAAALAVAALMREPTQILGSGPLHGGGLLPAVGARELLSAYLASWQDVRFGVPSQQPAYLPLLAAASLPLLGSVDLLIRLSFGLAVPLAFLSMYASLGPARAGSARIPLSLAWALLPAASAAAAGGRISTLGLLLLGPPTARLVWAALAAARSPGPQLRPAVAAGTMLGVTSAFAPLVLVLAVPTAVIAWLARGLPRWPVRSGIIMLVVPSIFLALWLPRMLAAPWLLLTDLGRNDPALGTPEPWVWGLSPGGPTAVPWAGVPLLVCAVLAALLVSRAATAVVALTGSVVLLAATAWSGSLVRAVWPDVDLAALWPGQMLLLAAGLLALVLATAAGDRGPGAAAASVALGGCVVVLGISWWVTPSSITVGAASVLPPVVALAEESQERPRTLLLERDDDVVVYAVSTGARARLGDADALAAPATDPAFTMAVEDLVSGVGGDVEGDLGRRGIRYVVLYAPTGDPLEATLDASPGLRRLAAGQEQSLWLVSGQPTRAELIGRTDDPDVVVPITTRPSSLDVVLHPDILLPRVLVLAEQADPGWAGSIAGVPLALSPDAQGMTVAQVAGAGRLTLAHSSRWTLLAPGHLVVMAILVVLALPKRRPVDPNREEAP